MNSLKYPFPSYRKFKGINVWFKIVNDRTFVEVKQIGSRFVVQEVIAVQYPEMVLIQDMLGCMEGRWVVIDEAEFESALAKSKTD